MDSFQLGVLLKDLTRRPMKSATRRSSDAMILRFTEAVVTISCSGEFMTNSLLALPTVSKLSFLVSVSVTITLWHPRFFAGDSSTSPSSVSSLRSTAVAGPRGELLSGIVSEGNWRGSGRTKFAKDCLYHKVPFVSLDDLIYVVVDELDGGVS